MPRTFVVHARTTLESRLSAYARSAESATAPLNLDEELTLFADTECLASLDADAAEVTESGFDGYIGFAVF